MAPPAAVAQHPAVPIPGELARFLEDGQIACVATRTADLKPEYVDASALRVEAERGLVTVFLPQALAGPTLANLRDNGQIAVGASRPTDHRSLQLKGVFVDERLAGEEDRAELHRYLEKLTRHLGLVGIPRSVCQRIVTWPSCLIRFAVRDIFEQSPGPGAGRRLGPGAAP